MKKMDFQLDRGGVRRLLNMTEMTDVLRDAAEIIRGRCGEGYAVTTGRAGNRASALVYPETREAAIDNAENNTLLRARGG